MGVTEVYVLVFNHFNYEKIVVNCFINIKYSVNLLM
jgi:hypothetical protein